MDNNQKKLSEFEEFLKHSRLAPPEKSFYVFAIYRIRFYLSIAPMSNLLDIACLHFNELGL